MTLLQMKNHSELWALTDLGLVDGVQALRVWLWVQAQALCKMSLTLSVLLTDAKRQHTKAKCLCK